jgi:hypothetical protein
VCAAAAPTPHNSQEWIRKEKSTRRSSIILYSQTMSIRMDHYLYLYVSACRERTRTSEYTVYSPRGQSPRPGPGSRGRAGQQAGPVARWSSARDALRLPRVCVCGSASYADTSRLCAPWTGVWSDLAGSGGSSSFGLLVFLSVYFFKGKRAYCRNCLHHSFFFFLYIERI